MVRRLLRRMEREEEEVAEREAQPIQSSSGQKATEGDGDHQNAGEINTGLKNAGRCLTEYNRYSWEHIQAATSSFSSDLVIGKGTYGTVYKAKFQHTVAAVKVLNSLEGFGTQQLQQELEVLGKIRHPHLLLLLGACPERGCVVYEYMENGSLDDALHHRRNGMPPLAWYDRVRVAWEVATAVAFLHSARPDPIIHRDLKPANILLDRNLSSKVGDVGLSTALLHHSGAGGGGGQQQSTMVRNTTPVGTFCYIDPEYQRTGAVSAKSDVYALGVVVLQLLTGRTSPLGLAHAVETALEEDGGDSFTEMLDATAGGGAGAGRTCAAVRRDAAQGPARAARAHPPGAGADQGRRCQSRQGDEGPSPPDSIIVSSAGPLPLPHSSGNHGGPMRRRRWVHLRPEGDRDMGEHEGQVADDQPPAAEQEPHPQPLAPVGHHGLELQEQMMMHTMLDRPCAEIVSGNIAVVLCCVGTPKCASDSSEKYEM
ncbi:putative U-box domain-containing protein 53 [Aegilops tauschii subsp. strangulata]